MTTSSATETLTIRLPAAAARRLHRVVQVAGRSLDEVVTEVLDAGLPPLLEVVPEAYRDDLASLERLSDDALWDRLHAQADPHDLAEYDRLLSDNASETLDDMGRADLAALRTKADRLMFEKAYAALLLKWRGHRVPSLEEMGADR